MKIAVMHRNEGVENAGMRVDGWRMLILPNSETHATTKTVRL